MKLQSAIALSILFGAFAASAQSLRDKAEGTIVQPAPAVDLAEQKWHVGAIGGTTDAGAGSDLEFGVDVGFQPYIPYGAGFELTKTDTGELSRTKALLRAAYNFGGELPVIRYSYLGVALGAVFDSHSDMDFNGTWLASGLLAGFDIPLLETGGEKTVSLGLQAQAVNTEGSAPDSFSLNGQVKYWF